MELFSITNLFFSPRRIEPIYIFEIISENQIELYLIEPRIFVLALILSLYLHTFEHFLVWSANKSRLSYRIFNISIRFSLSLSLASKQLIKGIHYRLLPLVLTLPTTCPPVLSFILTHPSIHPSMHTHLPVHLPTYPVSIVINSSRPAQASLGRPVGPVWNKEASLGPARSMTDRKISFLSISILMYLCLCFMFSLVSANECIILLYLYVTGW